MGSFIPSFTHPVTTYLLSTYYAPGTILTPGEIMLMYKADSVPAHIVLTA